MEHSPLLVVEGISKTQSGNLILHPVSFRLVAGKKLAIVGETGSGKSTLLKMIGGHIAPDSGKILFNGERVWSPPVTLLPGHNGIAYLSQDFELRNNYKVHELLSYKNLLTPESAAQLYQVCKVSHLMNRKNDELSGGERQRVALAKLLVGVPQLLLLDEPFSNLDLPQKKNINAVIHAISEQLKITCIMVSHDPVDTLSWADEIMVLKDGVLMQHDTPQQIYLQPANEYVAGLFGPYNLIKMNHHNFHLKWELNNKTVNRFIRPEQLLLSDTHENAVDCVVTHVLFCGAYWSVTASNGEQSLIIHTDKSGIQKGDLVWIAYKH
nr:ABC transporter ATP-binding protein [uncultured Sediminibacterium sp.]